MNHFNINQSWCSHQESPEPDGKPGINPTPCPPIRSLEEMARDALERDRRFAALHPVPIPDMLANDPEWQALLAATDNGKNSKSL